MKKMLRRLKKYQNSQVSEKFEQVSENLNKSNKNLLMKTCVPGRHITTCCKRCKNLTTPTSFKYDCKEHKQFHSLAYDLQFII